MYTLKSPIYIPMINWRSVNLGQHAICFRRSRILANAVPLGFWFGGFSSTAGYVPATQLNFRRANCPSWRVLFQRVPLVSEWLRKASRLSLAEPFGSNRERHRINSRLLILSNCASPHCSPIPQSVSKAVTFVTRALYSTTESHVNFLCVLFFSSFYFSTLSFIVLLIAF